MRRTLTYVVAVVGLLVLVAGIVKVLPGGIGLGVILILWGLALFGLSFVPWPAIEGDVPPPLSGFERITGLFYMPATVFRNLRFHPRWLVAILIASILSSAYTVAFTKRVGAERIAAQVFDKMEEKGWMTHDIAVKQKQDQVNEANSRVMQAESFVKGIIGGFFLMALLGGVYLLLVMIFGGKMNYWQAISVVSHAAVPVIVIKKVLSFVLLYIKDPIDIHPLLGQDSLVQDNLGILFNPSVNPTLYILASTVGVLSLYGLWLNATGLKNAGTKVSTGAAWGTTIVVFVVAIGLAIGWTTLFPVL